MGTMAEKHTAHEILHHETATEQDVERIDTANLPTILAQNISYGPSGVRGLMSSPYVLGAAMLASLGGFSFGYDQGVISIINVMPQFHARFPETDPKNAHSGFYTGFMTGMLEFGAFLGCFFMPYLADKISRKRALTVVVVIFNIGAIIQTTAKSYGALVAGRTIGGIGVGTLAMGAPLYISEISPPNLRGALLVLEPVCVVLGVVIAYWITFATRHISSEASFRLPFGLQMVCATLLGIFIHFFPYSPRWLGLVGRNQEALQSIAKLRSLPTTDERVQVEWQAILAEVQFQKTVLNRRHPGKSGVFLEVATWIDLFRGTNIKRTIVGLGIAFFQQLSGINGFIYYAPILFQSLGLDNELSLIVSGALNIWQLCAIILCFFIIDHVGRRPLAIVGGFGSMIPYIIMAVLVSKYSSDWAAHRGPGWACIAMAFVYILTYGSTYAPLGWALPPEVFANADRAKGVALSTASLWLWNFVIGVSVPPMIESAGYGTYVFFAVMCFLAGVWAYFFVPETKGKSLEELSVAFGDSSAREEQDLLREATVAVNRDSVLKRGDA